MVHVLGINGFLLIQVFFFYGIVIVDHWSNALEALIRFACPALSASKSTVGAYFHGRSVNSMSAGGFEIIELSSPGQDTTIHLTDCMYDDIEVVCPALLLVHVLGVKIAGVKSSSRYDVTRRTMPVIWVS